MGIAADETPTARKVIDFSGANPACVTCHKDQHKGDFGRTCDACHRADTFKAAGFVHPRSPEFYAGRHAGVACVKCHARPADIQAARAGLPAIPPRAKQPATTCDSCHADPPLGQVGAACDRCHAIDAAKFAAAKFSHDTAKFKLTGKHKTAECIKCHQLLPIPGKQAEEGKECRCCGGTNPREAKACRFCRRDLESGKLVLPQKPNGKTKRRANPMIVAARDLYKDVCARA